MTTTDDTMNTPEQPEPTPAELTPEQIDNLANLARLTLTDSEKVAAARALGDILRWVAEMNRADPGKDAPEMAHMSGELRLRDDNGTVPENRDALMQNAPSAEGDFFLVPKVVE